MQINEMRLSLVQFESQASQLRSYAPSSIPYRFLLDSGLFQAEFSRSLNGQGSCRAPWYSGYGRRFWGYYNQKEAPTPKDLWEWLVPFQQAIEASARAGWLKGSARARAYLYPWGIAAVLDLDIKEPLDIEQAVNRSISIRRSDALDLTLNGSVTTGFLPVVLGALRQYVRAQAYGTSAAEGTRTDLFCLATVLDADNGVTAQAIAQDTPLHRQLNGLARGEPNWKSVQLGPLAQDCIATRPACAGCVLFGTRRGRVAWFPESFTSAGPSFKNSLRCYHQNLTVATLHTEALCVLAKDAADWIAGGVAHTSWPVNFDRCARNAAGLLGRLNGGGKAGTYGSHSLQHQIKKTYEAEVNALRKEYGMSPLS
jgi:hypothetical protein